MREYKFRALTATTLRKFVYGYFAKISGRSIIFNAVGEYDVDPETVGQFAGKHDMNGDEIYDGDRIKMPTGEILTICWSGKYSSFCLDKCGWVHLHWFGETVESENCEIVGNVHVNPELMEASK